MITLRGKLKKDSDIANAKNRDHNKRVSIRDKLLIKEVIQNNKYSLCITAALNVFTLVECIILFRCKRWNRRCQ